MFVGHYGVSCGAKALERSVPLWVLFLAVQFLDVVWGVLVLAGIERVRIVPGITATNPLDLYFMPYSHSLPGALAWAVVAGVGYHLWRGRRSGARAGWVVGVAVFSHWLLDLFVHRPDLPLWGDAHKVGLGLWNLPAVALLAEIGVLFGGLLLYLRATERTRPGGTWGFVGFGVALVAVQVVIFFAAPPESPAAAATAALVLYAALAGVAAWLERRRDGGPGDGAPLPAST